MKRGLLIILSFVFLMQFISADNASSSSYSIESSHVGISEGNASSSSYSGTGTETISGGGNFTSSSYSGRAVWFPLAPSTSEEPPATTATTTSPGSGGGGGGGGVTAIRKELALEVIPESFGLSATIGVEGSAKLSIRNIGNENLQIQITTIQFDHILKFDESDFVLPV